jgi:hypothetical protein
MINFVPALGAICVQLAMKLVGYQFISRVIIYGCREFSRQTKTDMDDQVTEAMAEAWGIKPADLKALIPNQ